LWAIHNPVSGQARETHSTPWTRRRGHDPLLEHAFHTKSQTNHFNKKLYENLKEIHYNLREEEKKLGTNNIFFS